MAYLAGGGCPVAHAQQYGIPQTGNYPTQVDPWEIIIYEHHNFTGNWIRYKMEPGTRQKLVPQIYPGWESKVASIHVGSKVAVTLYAGRNFFFSAGDQHEETFQESVATVQVDYKVNSFIIYPKAAGAPLGVWLGDEGFHPGIGLGRDLLNDHAFFPLPEMEGELQAGWPSLGQFNLDKNANLIWLPQGVVSKDSIQAVLYDRQGVSLILPGAGGWDQVPWNAGSVRGGAINLGQFDWSDRAASLVVKWTGPPLNLGPPLVPVYLPKVNAPPSGFNYIQSKDLPGQDYNKFMMKGDYGECARACDKDPKCRAFTWVKPGVKGVDAACCLKSGVPVATQDPNCISGVRDNPYAKQKSDSALAKQVIILFVSGQWKSNIGLSYNITQKGNQFWWTVTNTSEKGQGVIKGIEVSASWSSPQGSGSSTGQITSIDPTGKATQIDWKNGVRFFR